MKLYNKKVKNFLDHWPGKKFFGVYRFLPLFFILGAALEFSMINWTVGETNFCNNYKFNFYFTLIILFNLQYLFYFI